MASSSVAGFRDGSAAGRLFPHLFRDGSAPGRLFPHLFRDGSAPGRLFTHRVSRRLGCRPPFHSPGFETARSAPSLRSGLSRASSTSPPSLPPRLASSPESEAPVNLARSGRSAKIVRLLRRVAGVRQFLTIESRLPMGAGGPCSAAPHLETRSVRCHRRANTPIIRSAEAGRSGSTKEMACDTPDRGGRWRGGGGAARNPPDNREPGTRRRTRETYGGTEDPHQAQGL